MSVIDLKNPEAVSQLILFRPQEHIRPLTQEPTIVPELIQTLPTSAKNKYFEGLINENVWQAFLSPDKTIDKHHQAILGTAMQFNLARRARVGAFSIGAMGASDMTKFSRHFKDLTSVEAYLPFTPQKKRKISRQVLSDIYPPIFSRLEMETGAVAVTAYFAYNNPDFVEEAADLLLHRLRRATVSKESKAPVVKPELKKTNRFIKDVLDEKNDNQEKHINFAIALSQKVHIQ